MDEDKEEIEEAKDEVESKEEIEEIKEEKPKRGRARRRVASEDSGDKETKPEKSTLLNKTATNWDKINFKCSTKNSNGKSYKLKISSWNIGGLKSWIKKECHRFLEFEKPDIICLQVKLLD